MKRSGKMLFIKRTDLPVPDQFIEPLTPNSDNIFDVTHIPRAKKSILNKYDILGDSQFKQSYMEKSLMFPTITNSEATHTVDSSNQSFNSAISGISANKRLSLQNCTVEELQQVNKDHRNIEKLEWYNRQWARPYDKSRKRKRHHHKIRLLEQPNPEKDEIVKQNYKLYWEKSLRNHDLAIYKHLKGAPFDHTQLKKSLQTIEGLKKLEQTIPQLPITKRKEGFMLRGRNKSELISPTGSNRAYSVQEVLKCNWDNGLSKLYNV